MLRLLLEDEHLSSDVPGRSVLEHRSARPRSEKGILGQRGGHLAHARTRRIRGGVCRAIHRPDRAIASQVEALLHGERNADRVGMVVLGTNIGLRNATGEICCDQNMPGLHIGFGATFPDQTGAEWDAPMHLVMSATGADVDLDGAPLLRSGRYLVL